MTTWTKNILILIGVMAVLSVIGHFLEISEPAKTGKFEQIVAPKPAPAAQSNSSTSETRYKACVAAAEKTRDVTWEINCEQLNDGAAQTYNECVTAHALANKSGSIAQDCQTDCILPSDVAKKIVQARDDAKAACLKTKQAQTAK